MDYKQIDTHTIEVGGKPINFEQRIAEVTDLPDRIIILLKVSDFEHGDPMVSRNVVAIGENGQELWRIQDSGVERQDSKEAFFGILKKDGEKKLIAVSAGFLFTLDPNTGKISNAQYRYMGD